MLRLRPSNGGGGGRQGCGLEGVDTDACEDRSDINSSHTLLGDPPPPVPPLQLATPDHHCDSATRLFFQLSVALMAMATATTSTVLRVDLAAPMMADGKWRLHRRLSLFWSRWTRRLLLLLYCAFFSSRRQQSSWAANSQPLAQRHPWSSSSSSSSSPSPSCPNSPASQGSAVHSSEGSSSDGGHRAHHSSCHRRNGSHHRHYRRRCHHPFLLYHLHFSPSSPSSSCSAILVNLLVLLTLVLCSISILCAAAANVPGGGGQAIHSNSQLNSHLSPASSASSSSSSRSGQANTDIISSDITNYEASDDPNAAASSSAQRRPPLSISSSSSSSSSSAPSAAPLTASNSLLNPAVMKEHVCGDIDIRNSVTQFYELENCTVVEGHVKIVLIDNGTAKDFANLTFPRLREITDYFLLFRIMGLQSLKRLFPNLAVIRGRTLLDNYALVIYEMLHLQEIGLTSLTDIVRGDVRIEKNPNLCFVDTIDWTRIARNSLILLNKAPSACPSCNETCPVVSARRNDGAVIGDLNGRICWTDEVCQKYACPVKCEAHANQTCSGGDCCPRECLGGCRWSTLAAAQASPTSLAASTSQQVCLTCRHFIYQNRCYRQCPPGTFEYFNRRCVTEKQCYSLSSGEKEGLYMKAFKNRCEATCPVGYMENVKDRHRCDHCGVECPKVCQSSVVSNIQSAQELKGCTIINGSLEIYISSGGAQIVKELEENLKDLSEITDFLKIARSYPLITLNFLRNLKVIHGNKLERQSFSLLVLDNPNLQDLWIFDNVTTSDGKSEQVRRLRIPNGRPFFHINPKLCVNKIEKMREYVDFGSPGKWNENEVSPNTNGDKVPCAVDRLGLSLWGVGSEVVGLLFEDYKPKMDDSRTLLGYLIYYRESEHRNVSIFDGRDACSDNEWTVVEFDIDADDGKATTTDKMINANSSPEMLTHIIPNLKPYTQYALYIKTYTLAIATRGAQSDIIYFKTKPSKPTPPRNLAASSKKYDEFELKWDVPMRPNGEIDRYYIKVTRDITSSVSISNHRDFCLEKDHHSGVLRGDTTTSRPAAAAAAGAAVASTTPPSPLEPMVNVWTNGSSDAQANMPWKKADGRQCCACKPTEKIRPMDVEQSINFEDFILNTVYVRRSKEVNMNGTGEATDDSGADAAGRRRRRNALNLEFLNDTSNNSTSSTTFADLSKLIFPTEVSYFSFSNDSSDNSSSSSVLSTTSAPSTTTSNTSSISNTSTTSSLPYSTTPAPEREQTYEKNVTRYRRQTSFMGLVHYTVYRIEMRACQDSSDVSDEANSCSLTAITTVRTLPLIGADDIDSRSVVYTFGNDSAELSNSLRLIHLRWDEPPKPNGIIHSYNIQHMRVSSSSSSSSSASSDNKKPTIECISRASYLKSNLLGYKLELTPGNHSVQVRARSLFGPGAWTEELYIFVEEPSSSSISLLIFLIVILSLLVIIAFVGLFAYKNYLKRMKIDYISVNPEYMSSNPFVYTPDPKWEVPRENVNLIRELGQGSFGMVYEGTMINDQKEMIRCAIKTINDESSNRVRFDFLKEADVMKSFTDSYHVVKLLGVVSKDAPVYVLMEIMPRGDLRKYLRENRPDNEENLDSKPPALEQLYKIAIEIADGMSYLASKKFVHRDLAARNCMVAEDLTVKIGDFGMTRDIYETDYYRKGGKGLLPVRWMSPESLKDGIFTTYSDVWSYGVVLWEMATLASQPYQGLSNEEVLKFVIDGGRMTRPENCPDILWNIMIKSWERKPKARPSFLRICEMLLEHLDIADKPAFLSVSYFHQWRTSRTEREIAEKAAVEAANAAALLEVRSPSTEQMEIEGDEDEEEDDDDEDNEDDEDEDEDETGKDETLIPLRQMSSSRKSSRTAANNHQQQQQQQRHESEEEGNSDYSTYEDDDDQLNEEDTNVRFFPLSRELTSDVRLFNSPEDEDVPEEKEKDEKEKKRSSSPVVIFTLRKGSKESALASASVQLQTKMTPVSSQSPKTTLSVKDSQQSKEKKSISLIGLHELLPVRRSSSSRGAASGLLKPEEKKGLLSSGRPVDAASSQRTLHSASGDDGSGYANTAITPSNNNNNNNNSQHHHLSANPLLSSASPFPPASPASSANPITSSSSTSNVNSSSSYAGPVEEQHSSPPRKLASKKQKPVITSTASPLKPSPSPPLQQLPSVTVVTPTAATAIADIDIDIVDGDGGDSEAVHSEASSAAAPAAASGRGLINGHLINTTTTSMV